MNYYLDIETTGTEPIRDKIITIQYMELERETAKPLGPLKILKEWESDEKTILTKFISETRVNDEYRFTFVPIGFNLDFEHRFFWWRCKAWGIEPISILGESGDQKPYIDLHLISILKNKGEFRGASLDFVTNKPHGGSNIPNLYREKKYAEIESYIKNEADEFVNLAQWLYREMPQLLEKFRIGN